MTSMLTYMACNRLIQKEGLSHADLFSSGTITEIYGFSDSG